MATGFDVAAAAGVKEADEITETVARETAPVRVKVVAFARLRELLGFGERVVDVPDGTTVEALWLHFALVSDQLGGLRASTRFARNGELAGGDTVVRDGDEIALLPPVGGG